MSSFRQRLAPDRRLTRNAVLAVTEKTGKGQLRSALMLPRLAIVDPNLTTQFATGNHGNLRAGCSNPVD